MWIVLVVCGVALVFADFFIPTFGLLSLTGLGLLVWAQSIAFALSGPAGAGSVVFSLALLAVALWQGYRLAKRTSLIHTGSVGKAEPAELDGLAGLVGGEAVAETDLRPVGKVRVGDDRFEARSESFVESGTTVRVVGVQGRTLVVREA